MTGILFLNWEQRSSKVRKSLWDSVATQSNATLVTDCKELKESITTVKCIITHREEYNACNLGDIDESIPIVVFTGSLYGTTIEVDKTRKNTYWLAFDMLSNSSLEKFFIYVRDTKETNSINKYINAMVFNLINIQEILRKIFDISPYLLLGEGYIPDSHRKKFDQLKKNIEDFGEAERGRSSTSKSVKTYNTESLFDIARRYL